MTVLDDFFTAMHKGASLVYHDILAVEQDIKQWRTDNPTVSTFIDAAVKYGTVFLTAHGLPIVQGEAAALAVLATLRDMASEDNSVNSITPVSAAAVATSEAMPVAMEVGAVLEDVAKLAAATGVKL